ncbi:MAG: CreA family protein [Arsenophonus sp. NC-TX2-MAG3]
MQSGQKISSVDTIVKLFSSDNKIVIERFDDLDINNIACYLSQEKRWY